ncbi:MAG: S24 family peptidase [Bacteroidales bacterium]|nr:S24 family peptidase [Bacteroidales bacterium]
MDRLVLSNDILLGEVDALLQEGREAIIRPRGNSMLPFIRGDRDCVVLKKKEGIAVGDIILVRTDGKFILHRVFSIDGDALTLMGDGNIRGKEHCTRADVIGTVTEIIRPNGRSRQPGRGRAWRALLPVRRYILAIYRRLI